MGSDFVFSHTSLTLENLQQKQEAHLVRRSPPAKSRALKIVAPKSQLLVAETLQLAVIQGYRSQ
jgi:hypothetical protein